MIVLATGLRAAREEDRRVLVQIFTQLGTALDSILWRELGWDEVAWKYYFVSYFFRVLVVAETVKLRIYSSFSSYHPAECTDSSLSAQLLCCHSIEGFSADVIREVPDSGQVGGEWL